MHRIHIMTIRPYHLHNGNPNIFALLGLLSWLLTRPGEVTATNLKDRVPADDICQARLQLARNIWLNYEGRRPELCQNGGYTVGFAEWLRAIDLSLHRRFCNVSMLSALLIYVYAFYTYLSIILQAVCYVTFFSVLYMTKNITSNQAKIQQELPCWNDPDCLTNHRIVLKLSQIATC